MPSDQQQAYIDLQAAKIEELLLTIQMLKSNLEMKASDAAEHEQRWSELYHMSLDKTNHLEILLKDTEEDYERISTENYRFHRHNSARL